MGRCRAAHKLMPRSVARLLSPLMPTRAAQHVQAHARTLTAALVARVRHDRDWGIGSGFEWNSISGGKIEQSQCEIDGFDRLG